jgi:hypothetical protein
MKQRYEYNAVSDVNGYTTSKALEIVLFLPNPEYVRAHVQISSGDS